MRLSWIIPAYNEERRIEKTLREVVAYLRGKDFEWEIIVADNNSKDRTAEIVRALSKEIPQIRLVSATLKGKGGAVQFGMAAANGDIRLFADADNSTPPESFDLMRPFFEKGYDVVISSRDAKDASGAGRTVEEHGYREVMGRMGNLLIQAFGVWGIWDTQNGFKAFTRVAAEKIFSRIRIQGFAFDIEVLALARMFGYRVGIIPVVWRYDADSKVTLKAYLQVFMDLFRIRWNIIRGIYGR